MQTSSPTAETLSALGTSGCDGVIRVPALHRCLLVDVPACEVRVENGGRARSPWALLAVHYLCATDISPDAREVSLHHFADCRGYLPVFNKRIIGRFLASIGNSAQHFAQRAEQLQGTRLPEANLSFRFDVLPRIPITLIRFDGDEELGPGANVLFRADIERLLPAEDRIVIVEVLLDALAGVPIDERRGDGDERRD